MTAPGIRTALWGLCSPGPAPAGPGHVATAAAKLAVAGLLAWGGYIHYDLYADHGYRHIHAIGAAFLVQAGGSFAVAALLVVSVVVPGSFLLSVLAAGLSAGALVGFVLSRTSGVAGFEEHGFTPAPEAAISVAVEIGVLLVLAAVVAVRLRGAARPAAAPGRPG